MTSPSLLVSVNEYLALRRGLGFEMETPSWLLLDFAQYADRLRHHGPLTVELAVQWALSSRSSDPAQAVRRLTAVRSFAQHLAVLDPATEVPPVGLLGRLPRRKQPHIYNDAEVAALLNQASLLAPRGGLRPRTYVAFFSLLLSTGLRLSEACRLTLNDVDLPHALLTVQGGKFRKSRLIPLHPSTALALTRYGAYRDARRDAHKSERFFCTDQAPALTRAAVEKTFSRLRDRLGWTAEGRARRPRIHDLRHTFTVRRLLRWQANGVDVGRKILALSTYLGHAKVTDTYWYLSAVPELMAITSQRFEHFAQYHQDNSS
jgi:integrase